MVLERVSKSFGEVMVLEELFLEVEKGEFLSLLAPSGCGKTTILRLIAGLLEPDGGTISIGGRVVFSAEKRYCLPAEEREVSMVFQSYALWPHMRVGDNVAYPLKIKNLPRADAGRSVENMLALVGLAGMGNRYPHQLSGGQQQRVALARALVSSPKILLLDEPLSNLDAKLREKMRTELKEIQERVGATIIYVTHDQIEALAMSDRVAVINKGKIQQVATPAQIYGNPVNIFVAEFVGNSNILAAVVGEKNGHQAKIQLARGPRNSFLSMSIPAGVGAGSEVKVVIQPENLLLKYPNGEKGGGEEENGIGSLSGLIVRRQFRGREIEYLVKAGDETLRVLGSGKEPFQAGDTIMIEISEGLVLPN